MIDNNFGKDSVSQSPEFVVGINGLREFMFERVYRSSIAKSEEGKAVEMIRYLFEYFRDHKDLLPRELLEMDSTLEQKVCDHISMMSDQYAVRVFEDITVPKGWAKF